MNLFIDFDGTIVDPAPRYHAVYRRCLARCASDANRPIDPAQYWAHKRERLPEVDILARHHVEIDIEGYHELRMALIEDEQMLALDALLPGTDGALAALAPLGKLYLVTMRSNRRGLTQELARLGIAGRFASVLSQHGGERPHEVKADLIRDLAKPGDWIVGDTEADIQAGKALGIHTCAVTCGIRTADHLTALEPDHVVDDLAAVPALLTAAR